MTRWIFAAVLSAVSAAAVIASSPQPAVLAKAHSGLWEISGTPGARVRVRECIADVGALARYEHRRRTACQPRVVRDVGSMAVVEYRCSGSEFGRSVITALTPRSLRIETQGISGGLPFNYVLQARRVGECAGTVERGH